MQKLIIYLHSYDSIPPDWVVMDDADIQQSVMHGNINELSQLAEGKQVIVMIPAQDVVLTSAKLPKMNRSRLLQALPFALEEQVIGEVEKLHFAPGENQADATLPVAIISKEKMQGILHQLQTLNIQPDILMSQVMALPMVENTWTVYLQDMAVVRINAWQGFACDRDNLNELLQLALQTVQEQPLCIHIHNYTHDASASNLTLSVKVREDFHDPKKFVSELAKTALKFPTINLLQGAYRARKSRFPEMRKVWKSVILLAAAWLVLLFLYPTISYFILKYRENKIDTQIAEIYKRHFPLSSNIIAPKLRMQEKLQKFTSQAGDTRLLMLMAYVGKGMREARGITLKRLAWQNSRLTLELSAASSEDFSALTDYLVREGIKVKHDNANLVGTRVNAVITVE